MRAAPARAESARSGRICANSLEVGEKVTDEDGQGSF